MTREYGRVAVISFFFFFFREKQIFSIWCLRINERRDWGWRAGDIKTRLRTCVKIAHGRIPATLNQTVVSSCGPADYLPATAGIDLRGMIFKTSFAPSATDGITLRSTKPKRENLPCAIDSKYFACFFFSPARFA